MSEIMTRKLKTLRLPWIQENYAAEAANAARKNWPHAAYLERLIDGEIESRLANAVRRRLQAARLPGVRTLEQFNMEWPKNINRDQVRQLFTLQFMEEKNNVVFIGGVGLGKTHLATALAVEACKRNLHVLFVPAVEMVQNLAAAAAAGNLQQTLRRYLKPQLLICDELGFLGIDRNGADLLFQVLNGRYERASTVITTNRVYRDWVLTFNNDATITSAVLDRVMHHCETVTIEGRSYRMTGRVSD